MEKKFIKDLDPKTNLRGVKFIYPKDGEAYHWYSQWNYGIWATKNEGDMEIIPLFVDSIKETLEWEIVQ